MDEECMELATIERLLKERDSKQDLLDLLNNGNISEVKRLLQRDIDTINDAIKNK